MRFTLLLSAVLLQPTVGWLSLPLTRSPTFLSEIRPPTEKVRPRIAQNSVLSVTRRSARSLAARSEQLSGKRHHERLKRHHERLNTCENMRTNPTHPCLHTV